MKTLSELTRADINARKAGPNEEDDMKGSRNFKLCDNPTCMRLVKRGCAYCCFPCSRAHAEGYEIHEDGVLAHTDACNNRHAERSREDI